MRAPRIALRRRRPRRPRPFLRRARPSAWNQLVGAQRRCSIRGRPYTSRVLRRRPFLAELALLVALTGAAAAVFGRGLRANAVYDEGVYMASLDALAHGQKLGSEIFASQPPGFYVLLEAERLVFGGSLVAIRVGMLAFAIVGCLCAYYVGRCLAGRPGGV